MTHRPRALDLFCGGGGAARGLQAAGFDVVGIDRVDHADAYPGHFVLADALEPPVQVRDFDLVWASPPCQAFSAGTPDRNRKDHPNLIPQTRQILREARRSVIENVPSAPIRRDVVLSGPLVGLEDLERRRFFELAGFWMWQPTAPPARRPGPPVEVTKRGAKRCVYRHGRWTHGACYVPKAAALEAMGLPPDTQMTVAELGESVPPAYAEIIGRAALADVRRQENPT